MADRDDRWNEDRTRSTHADRQPGGDRDYYSRDRDARYDTRYVDDYGLGYGEEGVTNYRMRTANNQQRGYGAENRGRGPGTGNYGGGNRGREPYRGSYSGGSHWDRNVQEGDFSRDFSSDQGFGYGNREYSNPYGYSSDYNRDYRSRYGDERRPSSDYQADRNRGDDRGFWDRAADEVSSWFGDDDAERRRRQDAQHGGRGPKGYRRSDERIREDVSDRLTDDAYVDASEIEVSVEGSEVTLTGSVVSRNARRRAEDLAERVSGVTHVQNNLRVSSGSESTREERDAAAQNPGLFSSSTKTTT
jgi:osmotically-inducible protein OsmY